MGTQWSWRPLLRRLLFARRAAALLVWGAVSAGAALWIAADLQCGLKLGSESSSAGLLFQDCFGYLGPLEIPYEI